MKVENVIFKEIKINYEEIMCLNLIFEYVFLYLFSLEIDIMKD